MLIMKKDMGGAAAALALAHMVMAAKLDVRLRVLIPAAENSIAGNAFRPGDVLTSRAGKTVEIGNTDAEGRLVLADALALADEERPDTLVSFATLTGAARVALGPELPPFYTDDDAFAGEIAAAGNASAIRSGACRSGPATRQPRQPRGRHEQRLGRPFAGSVTAALFLRRFVKQARRFAHFDIYGWRPAPSRSVPRAARCRRRAPCSRCCAAACAAERAGRHRDHDALDPRRHAYRDDLAARVLRGRVAAPRYVAGEARQVVHSATPLRARPSRAPAGPPRCCSASSSPSTTSRTAGPGCSSTRDGYVGYLRAGALSPNVKPATHRVRALGTFLYPAADVKAPPWLPLSMNALVSVAEAGPAFARLADGSFVPTRHIAELAWHAPDFVAVAERFIGMPYLWGGKTRLGLDCSGLVQVAMQAAGLECPRDSDMQQAELGGEVPIRANFDGLERGDLVFWKGHVGIMIDAFLLLHANAHHMAVAIEPLQAAADRIARAGAGSPPSSGSREDRAEVAGEGCAQPRAAEPGGAGAPVALERHMTRFHAVACR